MESFSELYIKHEDIIEKLKLYCLNIFEPFILISVMNGANMFTNDFLNVCSAYDKYSYIEGLDFFSVKSYSEKERTSVKIKRDIGIKVKNKRIIVLDDILDSGETVKKIKEVLKIKGAKKIDFLTVLSKKEGVEFGADMNVNSLFYIDGHDSHNWFYGYGMDLKGELRHLKDIYKTR